MVGLVPAVHAVAAANLSPHSEFGQSEACDQTAVVLVDGRVEPGHDGRLKQLDFSKSEKYISTIQNL